MQQNTNTTLQNIANHCPNLWIMLLFFTKGVVVSLLMYTALIMLKRMGLHNASITFSMALLMLPWVLRPILNVLVQPGRRNRRVILITLWVMAIEVAGIGCALTTAWWQQGCMIFLALLSFTYIFNDIATDKFCIKTVVHQNTSCYRANKLRGYCTALLIVFGVFVMIGGNLEVIYRSIKPSWNIVFYGVSGMMIGCSLLITLLIPRHTPTLQERKVTISDMFYAFLNTQADMIRTPRSWPGALFLILFLLPLALLSRISLLFFMDLGSSGGLGLSPQEVGFTQGTIGIFGMFIGAYLGKTAINKWGYKHTLMIMALATIIPSIINVHLSYTLPNVLSWIALCCLLQQTAYGFALYGYYRYLVYYSEIKQFSTYSLSMAINAMAIMVPVMFSGTLQHTMGYRLYFIMTTICTITTVLVTLLVISDPDLGTRKLTK